MGEAGQQQPTHSPLLGFNSRLIFFFCYATPSPALQSKTVLQAPLKPVNKGCRGCRKGPVLLSDCTWIAVIKWAIHPALPFRGSPTGARGGYISGRLLLYGDPGSAALVLIDLESCTSKGFFFFFNPPALPVASLCGGGSDAMRLRGG